MQHIDYGLAVLSAQVVRVRALPDGFDLADLYAELVARGQLAGYEVVRRFYEIGAPHGWAETDAYFEGSRLRAGMSR